MLLVARRRTLRGYRERDCRRNRLSDRPIGRPRRAPLSGGEEEAEAKFTKDSLK